jgi:23S rRNA (guanosine2251-2'-O)-methyltransferase
MVKIMSGIGQIVEGINASIEALKNNRVKKLHVLKNIENESYKLKKLIEISTTKNIPIEYVEKKDWKFYNRHSVAAECEELKTYDESNIEELNINKLIVLNHLQDTQNLGAIIRSAAAFDFLGVCIPKKRSVQISERTFSISSGGLEKVKIISFNSIFSLLKKLKSLNYWTIGLDMTSKIELKNLNLDDQKLALLLGGEESGLSDEVLNKIDAVTHIEMSGLMESLNVSVAGGIAMQHFFKKNS